MPVIAREGPYRFYWYSHEPNEPPHIHVDRDGLSAKYWLQQATLVRNMGFPAHELRVIRQMVERHQGYFLEAWHEYFGSQSR